MSPGPFAAASGGWVIGQFERCVGAETFTEWEKNPLIPTKIPSTFTANHFSGKSALSFDSYSAFSARGLDA
jgi:hypothetical protein